MKDYRIKSPRCWVIRVKRGSSAGSYYREPGEGVTARKSLAHEYTRAEAWKTKREWDGSDCAVVCRRGKVSR